MIVQDKNVIREITPLSEKDCFYIADRRKSEFTYPMHCHKEFELNFVINASGVLRIVGDGIFNETLLNGMPAKEETKFIRWVHFDKPLTVKMNGKKKLGVVELPEPDSQETE